jgi:eukaryotic-like serine/threonine-protein kinase
MALSSGTRLGPYELVAPVGAGGMGEVYRAKDTRLDRTVAIKVLPAHLSSSPDSRQRFEREAKTISQLSHPHICALYDVGREGEIEYLVMEYLEGETLSDRLLKGALPFEQVLRYGIEIADALDKAHRQGIVHRDLKPGNVMITKSGVKLLDFGLAKAIAPAAPQHLTSFPTQQALTQEGTILGTFQYMAPEQLEGREADARTDIFAFGTVLYEMATGQKAFSGSTQASLIAAIIERVPPPISTISPMTPLAFDRVVKTCLAKDPEDRWQTPHDVMLELKWAAEGGSAAGVPAPVVARHKSRERLAWALVFFFFLAAALATVGYLREKPQEATRVRSFLLPPENVDFLFEGLPSSRAGAGDISNSGSLTVSPDGRRVTFPAKGADGKLRLWLQTLEEPTARPITGTEDATFPFWSPDSGSLAFFAEGKLKKVDVSGGPSLTICDAPGGRSGSWNREDVIVFSPNFQSPIYRVPASGGAATPVTRLDQSRGETTHRWATFLPDGRHFLYLAASNAVGIKSEVNAIYLAALESSERRLVIPGYSNVSYAAGYLLYEKEGVLLAQRFDAARGRLTGDPVPLAEDVAETPRVFRAEFSVSGNNVLVYRSTAGVSKPRLYWYDRQGRSVGVPIGEPADYLSIAIAPDGKRFAAEIGDPVTGSKDVWLFDPRGLRTRLSSGGSAGHPTWSPDGSRIAYTRTDKQNRTSVYVKSLAVGGSEQVLYRFDGPAVPTNWSFDGRFLAVDLQHVPGKSGDIWIVPLLGDQKSYAFLATNFVEYGARFSPDGRFLAYVSDESGRSEAYVVPFPGAGNKWQVSTEGAVRLDWPTGGREILYLSPQGLAVMSVEVKAAAGGLEIGNPKILFKLPPTEVGATAWDGQRFLLAVRPERSAISRVALLTNWTAGLKGR